MSDTTRTDEAYSQWESVDEARDFARQLEREIAEAKQELADYKYSMGQSEMQKIHMLQMCEIKCDQLRRDKERLDWLDSEDFYLKTCKDILTIMIDGESLRSAIDAAMKGEAK